MWLARAGYRRIYVIDNDSSYPPLLAFLAALEDGRTAPVIRLDRNVGHLAVWREKLLASLGIDTEYVYTDPDIVPAECCPGDVVAGLQAVLADNPRVAVAGLGLRLDDLPDTYRFKAEAIAWERQFWLAPAASRLFHSQVDTTFALYRPGSGHCLGRPAIRTGWPCVAAHTSWYADDRKPSEEDAWYRTPQRRVPHTGRSPSSRIGWRLPPGSTTPTRHASSAWPRRQRSCRATKLSAGPSANAPRRTAPSRRFAAPPNAEFALSHRLRRLLKDRGRLVIHEREVAASQAGAILRGEPAWLAGWRLRRLVASGGWTAGELAVSRSAARLEHLMLHLEPDLEPSERHGPAIFDFRSDGIDHWAGFAVV